MSTASGCSGSGPGIEARAQEAAAALAQVQRTSEVIGSAEAVLVKKCVHEKGYPSSAEPQAEPDETDLGLLPPPTRAIAEEVGYGVATRLLKAQTPDESSQWKAASDLDREAAYKAAFGDPSKIVTETFDDGYTVNVGADGCYADVRRDLYGDLARYTRMTWIASQSLNQAKTAVAESSKWQGVASEWRVCIEGKGLNAASSGAIRANLYEARGAVAVSSSEDRFSQYLQMRDNERELATADADCAEQAGAPGAWIEAVSTANAEDLAKNHDALVEWAATVTDRSASALESAQDASRSS
ncbi:hypothetical protein FDO65_18095 [Nakamurella flava]|uniref:Uncharacterized protein n=1 Tax=Nakamurella flava TaxID=2576308 RepID=A0A4V6CSX4_9ACTN|nr:hypothetical protein [Nakamurella flava]TKV56765.1 hypothetical protein FDO65_18095 [Nakamurella flava]